MIWLLHILLEKKQPFGMHSMAYDQSLSQRSITCLINKADRHAASKNSNKCSSLLNSSTPIVSQSLSLLDIMFAKPTPFNQLSHNSINNQDRHLLAGYVHPRTIEWKDVLREKKSGCPICGSRAHKPFLCPQRRAGPPNPNRRPPTSSTTARVILEEDSSEDNSMICTLVTKYTHPQSSQPRSLIYRLSIKGGVIDVFVDLGSELSFISEKVVNDRMILTTPLLHPVYIIFADKSRVRAHAQVIDLQISKREWSDKVTCVVVVLSLTEPIYLGRDWFRKWNPTIDWISGEIQLSRIFGAMDTYGQRLQEGKESNL